MRTTTALVINERRSAFTLLEILVVVLIVSLILGLTAPAISDSINATRLTSAGDQLVALLSEAQQTVSTEGIALEVQFLKHKPKDDPQGDERYRTVLLLRRYEKGQPSPEPSKKGEALQNGITMVMGAAIDLPSGFVLSENPAASTLISSVPPSGTDPNASTAAVKILRGGVLQDFAFPESIGAKTGFIMRSEGTNLNSSNKWFVTLVKELDEKSGKTPQDWKNFYCIQVNPVTGGVISYRP